MNLTRVTLATASSVLVLATLAACGSDSTDTASDSTQAAGGQAGQVPGGQGGIRPGASGKVAAVSGSTAQVQSQATGQVAVSWTEDTTFTQQVDATLADVTVGSCVMVTSADDDTAATVRVMAASDDGGCGFGGGGQRPEGAPSGMPTDRPSDRPSDRPDGGGRGFGTVGEVTAVSGTGFTVSATQPGADDATGAVAATTISVSQPVDGECTGGFGMGGMGGGRPGGAS